MQKFLFFAFCTYFHDCKISVQPHQTYSFKTVIVGQASVGKSSILYQLIRHRSNDTIEPTIGASFYIYSVNLQNETIKFEIFDTAGQNAFQKLLPMYLRNSKVVCIVYDITSKESFERAKELFNELKENGVDNATICLVGNKSDLSELRQVSQDEGKQLAQQQNCLFFESSAKTGEHVQEIFNTLAEKVEKVDVKQEKVQLDLFAEDQKQSKGCC